MKWQTQPRFKGARQMCASRYTIKCLMTRLSALKTYKVLGVFTNTGAG